MTSDELLRAACILFSPGQVAEVRAICEDGMASGYFDDPERLAAQAGTLDGLAGVHGIYVTLNEVKPALLSRRANRIKTRLSKKDATTADTDIVRRCWFPVDIDPVRPSGVSSSDGEHQAALDAAARIASYLSAMGWPEPVVADSGNGAHLLYRIDLPNDERSRDQLKGCLEVLAAIFDDEIVTVDTANYNAARIWKLYGTMSRKGDNTRDRPHRRSRFISVPSGIGNVGEGLLEGLYRALPAVPKGKRQNSVFDLASWLKDHGIGISREKPYQGGTLYIFDECPFSASHRDGAFAIRFANGAIHAGCHHTSCGGGAQRWQELRDRYEPDRPGKIREKSREVDPPASDPSRYRQAALDVLAHGDPIGVMLEAFGRDHVGDEILARCLIYSMASQAVRNSDGLHVSVTGESGKGKTHAYHKMLRQVPDRYKIKGTLSNKALYYMNDLAPRSVLMSDDVELSDGIQEILKAATSNFHDPITHTTVTKDLTCRVCTIPERCVWWIAKKEGTGDDQVLNRMLTCWIDESSQQDERVLAVKQKRETMEPDELPSETPELLTARAIWEYLQEQMIWVVIPFSERIRFRSIRNRRNPDMLYDLIKSHALLHFMQRRQKTAKDGTLIIFATGADFAAANEVYTAISGTSGGQESKLTRKEAELINAIRKNDQAEFTIPDLQQVTGWSYIVIYRTLKGYDSRGKNHTGLLEKCPAISFTDRTVMSTDDTGNLVRRRAEAFSWNVGVYRDWQAPGPCWIDRDPDDGDDSFTALPQVFSNFSAGDENQNGTPRVSGSSGTPQDDNNSLQEDDGLQQKSSAATGEDVPVCDSHCVHTGENADIKDRSPRILPEPCCTTPERTPLVYSGCTKPAEDDENLQAGLHPEKIKARDYKQLDTPEHTPCFQCSGGWSHYVEMLTGERKARPIGQQGARRICKLCYAKAKRRSQQESVILPGTFDPGRMEQLKGRSFRCSACELETAVYLDRGSGVKLCEFCYKKACRSVDRGEAAG